VVEAETRSHLWSDNFDRELTAIFAIQDEIARKIAEYLQLTLTGVQARHSSPGERKAPPLTRPACWAAPFGMDSPSKGWRLRSGSFSGRSRRIRTIRSHTPG